MPACPTCATENAASAKFCKGCGTALARTCPGCGVSPPVDARFCPECGTPLGAALQAPPAAPGPPPAPVAERRLVTVLFADLVGFTSLSQARDPEDVRELLSRYFDTCSSLVERYGGVVEKFIGDAVMAVWGAPVAQEDDAERAVRTALDLVDAVAALGAEVGAPQLAARAGVLTGEAAVTVGAKGQGMVAGDLVNTASRVQSVAEPGTVLVGDATRRATDAAIVYEDAGTHELKGKDEPVVLHRAVRVVAGVGGLMKSEGLEPPFVGRDGELRLVKELFHVSSESRRAQLVQVTGIAGIGKSRLAWEFFKYIDGIKAPCLWHRGRCLAYGEGVTYWALAEMVRGRAGILEGEDRASAAAKLRATLERHVPDAEDRRFLEPRLAQLVGVDDRSTADRQELFSAWRLFFERLAEQIPVLMVFEDMQWADPSLLEFVTHLLERSKNHAIFVMTLARPETPAASLGATQRNATFIHLEPLSPDEMRELLAGFAPGLPEDLTDKVLARAEGVPLYAVETVRMLLDRGLLVQEGSVYRPTGEVGSLEVPETLHALVAARLDGLSAEERRVVQTASVLGKSFTKQAVAELAGSEDAAIDEVLASLVAKEILTVYADPRSPERGQYGFVQDLMRTVAYETLSRHERRRMHLEAASYLERAWGDDEEEVVEVAAAHLLVAWRLDEAAPDAGAVKARGAAMLERAGRCAALLGATGEAQGYFEQAAALSDDPTARTALAELAGRMAELGGRFDAATGFYEQATEGFRALGLERDAARCQANLANVEYGEGHLDAAIERMAAARRALEGGRPDASLAVVTAQLGRFLALANRDREALDVLDEALELAQHLALHEVYAEALNSRSISLMYRGRVDEALTLLGRSLELALEHDLTTATVRAANNLRVALIAADRLGEALEAATQARDLARRLGGRDWELRAAGSVAELLVAMGRWDEALVEGAELDEAGESLAFLTWYRLAVVPVLIGRGDVDAARLRLERTHFSEGAEQGEVRATYLLYRARVLAAEGRHAEAADSAEQAVASRAELGLQYPSVKRALVLAVDESLALGDTARAAALLHQVGDAPPGEVSPWLHAQVDRLGARLAALAGDPSAGAGFESAVSGLRRLDTVFDLAVALLEHGEWLAATGDPGAAEAPLSEALAIFERLGARPYVLRAGAVAPARAATAAAPG